LPENRRPQGGGRLFGTMHFLDALLAECRTLWRARTLLWVMTRREVAARLGVAAYMVDKADELRQEWFVSAQRVGLSAGASAPSVLVDEVIQRLRQLGALSVRKMQGIQEVVKFPLPKGLRPAAAPAGDMAG